MKFWATRSSVFNVSKCGLQIHLLIANSGLFFFDTFNLRQGGFNVENKRRKKMRSHDVL